jgi:hypothetical protein
MPSNESKVALEMAMVVACSAMSSTALHVVAWKTANSPQSVDV